MRAHRAILTGVGRAAASPALVLGLWAVNFLFALPMAVVVGESIHRSVRTSLVHRNLRDGFDMGWFGEYTAGLRGLEATFTPTHSGAGAFFDNLEAWVTGSLFLSFPIVAFAGGYVLIWALLTGGVLERYANPQDRHNIARFFRAGGRFYFRFVRLMLIAGGVYYFVYRFHRWSYEWVEDATRDVTSERTVLLWSLAAVLVTALLLIVTHVGFAYAKIATVVEDRRSALLSTLRGFGFVLSHPGRTMGVYFGFAAISFALLTVWAWVAPGAGQSTWTSVLLAFVAGQVFLMARLWTRLGLLAGQAALYESLLSGN